jgi:pyridoxal phosphate enzyme (YggS family)
VPDPSGVPRAGEPPDPAAVIDLVAARARVLAAIAGACARGGRQPAEVTLVAVGKTVDGARLRAAVAAGFADLGENRVQEAEAKVQVVEGATWHLVGPLQANKARRAVAIFDVVETVDSLVLAGRLDRLCAEIRPGRPLPVFLQVNVDADPAKAGFAPDELVAALPALAGLPNLELLGLMTVGRAVASAEAARPTFRTLRELSERLRDRALRPPGLAGPAEKAPRGLGPGLSMGMSDDYPVAIEEGATLVRVGRAIFGPRPGPAPGGGAGRAGAIEEPSRGRSFTRPHPGRLVR